jgi:plastocyanin
MSRRLPLALLGAIALIAGAIGATTASADKAETAQSSARIDVVGGVKVRPGVSVVDNQRFTPRNRTVSPGATITIRNRATTQDPHTFSIVRAAQIPRSAAQLNRCFEGGVCGELFQAHEVPEGDGPPGKPVVNVGEEGFDQPGDSVVFAGRNAVRVKITAARGANLSYLCAVHPWMSGRVRVR